MSMVREEDVTKFEFEDSLNQFPEHQDMESVMRYLQKLHNGKFKKDQYFGPQDNEIFHAVMGLFNAEYGTEEYTMAVAELEDVVTYEYNLLTKNVGPRDYARSRRARLSYFDGRSGLKDACWIVVHSYIMNSFYNGLAIQELIPLDFPELAGPWNQYLMEMDDVPVQVRALFILDHNNNCEFISGIPATHMGGIDEAALEEQRIRKQAQKVTTVDELHPEDDEPIDDSEEKAEYIEKLAQSMVPMGGAPADKKSSENPIEEFTNTLKEVINISSKDDKVDDSDLSILNDFLKDIDADVSNIKHILRTTIGKIKKSSKRKKGLTATADVASSEVTVKADAEEVKDAEGVPFDEVKEDPVVITVENPIVVKEDKEPKKEEKKGPNIKTQKNYSFGFLKSNPNTEDEETDTAKMDAIANTKMGSKVYCDVDVLPDDQNPYIMNNNMWHHHYPNVKPYTNLIHRAGYYVVYSASPMFPGIIVASLINKANEMAGLYMIDPGIVYGDTYRIVTTFRQDGNILKEAYIPKNQSDIILNMLQTGTLPKEDRDKLNNNLPRGIYDVLEHVDLRMLGEKFGGKMNFNSWRSMITNMTKIIPNMPNCRFRVMEFNNPKDFKLVCDENVTSVRAEAMQLPDQAENATKKLMVHYNPKEYGDDKLWGVSYLASDEQINFDPYKVMPKKKEEETKKEEVKADKATAE